MRSPGHAPGFTSHRRRHKFLFPDPSAGGSPRDTASFCFLGPSSPTRGGGHITGVVLGAGVSDVSSRGISGAPHVSVCAGAAPVVLVCISQTIWAAEVSASEHRDHGISESRTQGLPWTVPLFRR